MIIRTLEELPRDIIEDFETWEKHLEGLNGWFSEEEIREELQDATEREFWGAPHKKPFLEFVNQRDRITIQCKGDSGRNGVRYYIETEVDSWKERYSEYVEDFDERQKNTFYELLKEGLSPQVASGTVYYVSNSGKISKNEAAEEYNTNATSIRTYEREVESKLRDFSNEGGSRSE